MPEESSSPLPTPTPWRLFIAISLPTPVRKQIEHVQEQLRRTASPGSIRWTPPEQFHLTLNFLGDVPVECLEALQKAIAGVCAEVPPLELSAVGLGFFPDARHPRVIWVGAGDKHHKLAGLHHALAAAVAVFVPPRTAETFSGHITLGRFKQMRRHNDPLLKFVAASAHRRFGDWTASAVELFRSDLHADGVVHDQIRSYALVK